VAARPWPAPCASEPDDWPRRSRSPWASPSTLATANIAELRQLSDLYSFPEQLAATSLLMVIDSRRAAQESCVHRLNEAQMPWCRPSASSRS
jgi:hypothetical protein